MLLLAIAVTLLTLQASAQSTNATATGKGPDHLVQPAPTFGRHRKDSYDAVLTQTADPAFDAAFKNKTTWDAPDETVQTFATALKRSRFKTLARMINTQVPTCGYTLTNVSPVNATTMSTMSWQNDDTHVGFSQHGPCEVYIDQKRVFRSDCCRQDYSGYPAEIPIDFSECQGRCLFKFYWLTLEGPEWHAYKQCVPIVYSGPRITKSSASDAASVNATTTVASANVTVEAINTMAGRVHAAAVDVTPQVFKVST